MFEREINTNPGRPAAKQLRPLAGIAATLLLATGGLASAEAAEQPARTVQWSLEYNAGIMAVAQGGLERGATFVDGLVISADVDLDRGFGWRGVSAHFDLMANSGGLPSEKAGSVLGVNGDEVEDRRLRLGQAYIQKGFAGGRAELLFGYYDIGSDFYALEAADPLVGAGSGLAPELGESGPNGPSDAPETALTLRLKLHPTETSYAQLMVADGLAGVLGDADGPDLDFRDGLLVVGEAGLEGRGKLAVGAWRYTQDQPDLRDLTPAGDPVPRASQGVYVLGQAPLTGGEDDPRRSTVFAKAGLSDGATTPFSGSWTIGLRVDQLWVDRPDSSLTFAVTQGRFTGRHRANQAAVGLDTGPSETDVELTYADRIGERLVVQPDLQWIHDPSGDRAIDDALVVGLRVTLEL